MTGRTLWRSGIVRAGLLVAATGVAYLVAYQWMSLAFVGTLVILVFGHAARRDPVGFGSVALPAVALAVAGGLAPTRILVGALGACACVFVMSFLLGENRLWAWWSRVVLRRPLPSPARSFERLLALAVRAFSAATIRQDREPMTPHAARAQAQAARDELAALTAPDDDWEALRAGYVAAMTDGLEWWFDGSDDGRDMRRLADPLHALAERQMVLRGREPEWIGLFPTLPKADVRYRDG